MLKLPIKKKWLDMILTMEKAGGVPADKAILDGPDHPLAGIPGQ